MTRRTPSTKFIALGAALEHVEAREGALAERLLTQALAEGLPARGYVIYSWPPYSEGHEQLSPELFTTYPPQHGPARINWGEGSAVMDDSHPHPACRVLNIEVSKAELLARWPGKLRRAARRPRIRELVKQAATSGARVTLPDGTKLDFSKAAEQQGNELDQWIAKHARATEGY